MICAIWWPRSTGGPDRPGLTYNIRTLDMKDRDNVKWKYKYIGTTYLAAYEIEQLGNPFMQNSADSSRRVVHDVGSDIVEEGDGLDGLE